jgi:hypothetical protein
MALSVGRPLSSLYHVSIGIALVAVSSDTKMNHPKVHLGKRGTSSYSVCSAACPTTGRWPAVRNPDNRGWCYLSAVRTSQSVIVICQYLPTLLHPIITCYLFIVSRGGWLTGCFICRCDPKHRVGIQQEEAALVINLRTAVWECLHFIWFVNHIHLVFGNCTQYTELIASTRSWKKNKMASRQSRI